MSLKRIITLAFYLLVLIVSCIGFYYLSEGDMSGEVSSWLTDENLQQGAGILINLSFALVGLTVLFAMVLSPIINFIQDPKKLVSALIGLGVIGVVFLIGYLTAGDTVTLSYESLGINTPGKSKLVGGMLNATYILIIVAVIAYLYSSVMSLIKQQS